MVEKYYLDTCIWIDYLENRSDKFRPLGEWAFGLIKKIIKNEDLFLITEKTIEELENVIGQEETERMISTIPPQLKINIISKYSQKMKAKHLKERFNIPFGDALHIIIAEENKAIFVTRDEHFQDFSNYFEIKKPEELI